MKNILITSEEKATNLLTRELGPEFLYHNLRHTQRVVSATKEILEAVELSKEQNEQLLVAAWFHDTGYTKGTEGHEENSCLLVQDFLKEDGKPQDYISKVCDLIHATKRGHEPQNLSEEILRDADASHFAIKNYSSISEMLREELDQLGIASYSLEEWREKNIEMFRTEHRYYTDYAQKDWQKGKGKNLRRIVKSIKKAKKEVKKATLKAKYKGLSPDRGVQTLFRVAHRNHIKLSDIADTKANILLSVNAIIISLALANLIPKLDNPSNDYLIYPTAIFIVFSIISMILSILATRPNVTSGQFRKEDIKDRKVNLIFFGNFHKMKLEDYEWAMTEMINDQDYIYSTLTKDLYFLGAVLERKYKILRWTYTIFMIGMILSVIAFAVSFRYYAPQRLLEVAVS